MHGTTRTRREVLARGAGFACEAYEPRSRVPVPERYFKQVDRICSILADRMTPPSASNSCIARSYSQRPAAKTYLECALAACNRHPEQMSAVPTARVEGRHYYLPRKSRAKQWRHRANQRNRRVPELLGHRRGDSTRICCAWELTLTPAANFQVLVAGQLGTLARCGSLGMPGSHPDRL